MSAVIPALMRLAISSVLLAAPSIMHAAVDCGTNMINTGAHRIFAWTGGDFSGWMCRGYSGDVDYLGVNVDMNGGCDAGVNRWSPAKRCDSMALGIGVSAYAEVRSAPGAGGVPSGSGMWYLGPKTIISSTANYTTLDNNYECYVIERSELGPSSLVSRWGLQYKGEETYDGSVYKHYARKLGLINQIFTIRQNYRTNAGWTSVGYIQRFWRNRGLVPNWYNLGWKYNVEFEGQNKGYIQFSYLSLPVN